MTPQQVLAAILVGTLGAPVVACSSGSRGGPLDAAASNAGGSDGGHAVQAGEAGAASSLVPPSAGAAGEGEGEAGEAGAAATTLEPCTSAQSCLKDAQCLGRATCIAADPSPWIVYEADDDTPAVPEVYALKRGLAGKMTPIKLNDALEPGWTAFPRTRGWSPDHQLFAYGLVSPSQNYAVATELVYFGGGLPSKPTRLEGEDLEWSHSGHAFAMDEAHGIAIYEYASNGEVTKVFSAGGPDTENAFGSWTVGDVFVFASTSMITGKTSIQRVANGGTAWTAATLIDNIVDFWRIDVSPTGNELVYELQSTQAGRGPLSVLRTTPGSVPKLLEEAGGHEFRWSPNGDRFLLFEDAEAGSRRVYLGTGSAYTQTPQQIVPNIAISNAGFTPDGKQIVFTELVSDWAVDIRLLDPAKGTDYSSDWIGRTGPSDIGPVFAPDNDMGVLATREEQYSDVALQLFSLSGRVSAKLDSMPYGNRYANMQFSAHGEFLVYTTGVDATYDGAYVDLRYGTFHKPKPVRLPGEGRLYTFALDPSGTGLTYVREKDNGARDCFYLDLSRQVAKDPVKIGRDGRVDYCLSQPVSK